jgi:hypothetical protein
MKSIFIGLFIACLLVQPAIAQQKKAVSQTVKDAFAKSYAGATKVKWEREDGQYEVSFLFNGRSMSVVYENNGTVVETETVIAVSELPKAAWQYALAKGTIKEASKIIKANGSLQYEAEVKHKDLLFDEKGNFIGEKEDKE